MHLLAADRVRFGRRRDLRLLVALVPVVLAFMFIAEFNSITTPPQANFVIDPPDPVQEAELKDQMLADWHDELARELPAFAFPASLVKVAGNSPPLILLAIYLATALVAGEFEWGTVRTIHLTSRRGRTLAVRVGVVIGLMAVVAATGLLFAAILPFLLSFEGKSIQSYATPVPDLATAIAGRLTVVLPFIAVPVLMAIVARSIGFAFLLTVLVVMADLAVTGAPFWSTSPVPWVPAVTMSGSIARLSGGSQTLEALAPAAVSVTALLAWGVVPILLAIFRFRHLDLNE